MPGQSSAISIETLAHYLSVGTIVLGLFAAGCAAGAYDFNYTVAKEKDARAVDQAEVVLRFLE